MIELQPDGVATGRVNLEFLRRLAAARTPPNALAQEPGLLQFLGDIGHRLRRKTGQPGNVRPRERTPDTHSLEHDAPIVRTRLFNVRSVQ